jgi:hypothetical protein
MTLGLFGHVSRNPDGLAARVFDGLGRLLGVGFLVF